MTFRNNIGPDAVAAVACLREWRRAAAAQSYRPMAPLAVERAQEVAEYLSEHYGAVERLYDDLQTAWEAYVSAQEEIGEPIDKELDGMMGRFDRRYEKSQRGIALVMELEDL